MRIILVLLVLHIPLVQAFAQGDHVPMRREQASLFAQLALKGLLKEYPYKPADVLNGPSDILAPRVLHPAFYGSYDWHSSVHGHWMLVRLLRLYPDLPEGKQARTLLSQHLTAQNLQKEADYFRRPNAQSFERPYGWAWLLKLAEELQGWDDPQGKEWAKNLRPLAEVIVSNYLAYFPKQTYPIRSGVHTNTAFGLAFAHDYARAIGHQALRERIEERARKYFAKDTDLPARWEPDGADFFSPSLMEADLMRRILPAEEFRTWLRHALPGLARGEPMTLLEPAQVMDRRDPQLVHLDGLNLSRAWGLRSLASSVPINDPIRTILATSAARHTEAALPHVASGDYVGEHWLASFAVYLLSLDADVRPLIKRTYIYKTVDGVEIAVDVTRPDDKVVRPVLIWLHGGALIMGHRNSVPQPLRDLCQREGYVLASFDYRLAPEVKLPRILEDVQDAFRWIHDQGPKLLHIDPKRVAVAGGSAGGYLTLMTGFAVTPRPQALVAYWGYGDVDGDWYTKPSEFYRKSIQIISKEDAFRDVGAKVLTSTERLSGDEQKARGRFYHYLRQNGLWTQVVTGFDPEKERSKLDPYCPVRNITFDYPPTILIHGTEDTDVPYELSVNMAKELSRQKVAHELITVPGAGHGLSRGDKKLIDQANQKAMAFLIQHLK